MNDVFSRRFSLFYPSPSLTLAICLVIVAGLSEALFLQSDFGPSRLVQSRHYTKIQPIRVPGTEIWGRRVRDGGKVFFLWVAGPLTKAVDGQVCHHCATKTERST